MGFIEPHVYRDSVTFDWNHSRWLNTDEVNRLAVQWRDQPVFRIERGPETSLELWIDHPSLDRPILMAVRRCPGGDPEGYSEYAREETVANLAAWIELTAGQSASKPVRIKRDRETEARDKWIYQQCDAKVPYSTIIIKLKEKVSWELIDTPQGILAAARRYATRHDKPQPPPRRQSNST